MENIPTEQLEKALSEIERRIEEAEDEMNLSLAENLMDKAEFILEELKRRLKNK